METRDTEWWLKHPTLILNRKPEVLGAPLPASTAQLEALVESLYRELVVEFRQKGCPLLFWDGQPIGQTPSHAVIITPVFLELPQAAQLALTCKRLQQFKLGLKEHFPETFPLIVSVGRNQMALNPPLHPNFVNLVCIDDTSSTIRNLTGNRKVIFIRTLAAKLGSFKNIIVPYERDREGRLTFRSIILGTLEGGHPLMRSISTLAKRLMVFASATEVGGWKVWQDVSIPKEAWQSSAVVKGLVDLGRFLGKRRLLSPPVRIRQLVKSRRLATLIVRLVRYSRQAEGAFMAFEPEIDLDLPGFSWTGVPIVTCSGRFGAIKSRLTYGNLAAVVPSSERDLVRVIPVKGTRPKGPSVEAEEFISPQLEIMQQTPIRLRKVEGGYRNDERGDIIVPPFRGIIHLHRGFAVRASDKILVVPSDIARFPPVGCGVDLMHEMSRDAMRRAVHLWEEAGRKAIAALFYVPNHGTNLFAFWAANAQGIIPQDPFELVKELISNKQLALTPEVPQV